ncbi:MAG: DNA internalization-related competence protein ComEC/Rec2 [Burkholderiaceae bacterium]|nr:DNA internalization-related competence protein ComEC/Rec2 [Burkholderiaceae bacterium]
MELNLILRRPAQFAPVLSGLLLGTALQLQQPALWSLAAYGCCVAAAVLLWCCAAMGGCTRLARAALAALALALASGGLCGWRAALFQTQALPGALEGADIVLEGRVAAMPQPSEEGVRFRFDTLQASVAGHEVRVPPSILLSWYNGFATASQVLQTAPRSLAPVRAGERWRFTVRLRAPHGSSNPLGFDYELWLWEQGLQATGQVRAAHGEAAPLRLGQGWRYPVERARQAVRDTVFAHVGDARSAGVLAALIVGDQNAIAQQDWELYRATGVAHLMSISGLHITMFSWVAALVCGSLWRRSSRLCLVCPAPHAGLLGGAALAAGYALFSGWGVPAQRTVCMLLVAALLRLSGRLWPWQRIWLTACAAVLLLDPWAMLQAGFWLSFVAVGVLCAVGSASAAQCGPDASPGRRLRGHLMSQLRQQWVLTLALTPLTLLLFNEVSLVGFVANALAIPWVTALVTPLAMGGVLLPLLWTPAAWALELLHAGLGLLASWPQATVSAASPPLWAAAAAVAGGALLAARLPWGLRCAGLPMMLPALLWQPPRPIAGEFELLAADVGQGNAVLIRTATRTMLYDSGPRLGRSADAGQRVLAPLLRARGDRLDLLLVSHRDADHAGGAATVLKAHPQAGLLASIEETHPLQALRPARRCAAGQRWRWDGVDFEILHPQESDYQAGAKPNTLSCVLRIASAGQTALLAGDIEKAQEAKLVQSGAAIAADVLLVPHHGSKTSSSADFLDAVHPHIGLLQAGYRNRFGHPAPAVLARYRERGIQVFDSPHCGAALWVSVQPRKVLCHREAQRRYWHHLLAPPTSAP